MDDKLSQRSQLSPSEPLYLRVRFRELFRVMSENKILLDELLSNLDPYSSRKQGKCLPLQSLLFANTELFTLEWSKSFDKFDIVLEVTFGSYAGVCILLPRIQKHPPDAGAIDLRIL